MGDLSTQIHHVIPINVFNDFSKLFQKAFGTNELKNIIQSYNNRMTLFTEEGPANALRKLYREGDLANAPLGATKHNGSHPNYDNAVREIIDGIVKNSNLTDSQKRTMLIDMQSSLREMLQSGHPPINADEAVISREIKSKMASADEILSEKGDNYKRALEREARYDANNKKYPDLMKDSVATDAAGKFTNGASNDNFVKATGHEIAKALLDADKKEAGKNKAAGKEEKGFLNDKSRTALEEVVSGKRKDNNKIRDAISRGVYDYDGSLPARRTSIAGFRNQRGFIDFNVFTDGTIKAGTLSYGVARDVWHTMSRSNLMAQNIMVPDGKGGLRFNPTLAEGKFGTFLKDKFWGGKVGLGASAAVFLDQTFNGLIKGIETGDWQDFQDAAIKYGVDAVETALGFVIATEAIGVTAALAGDTVIGAGIVLAGEVALAGMMLLGAFAVGWSIGSLLRKGWNWLTGNHDDWDNLPREDGYIVYDPLTLDLDGDGIEAIASNGHKGALFDHDKDGIRTATGWISKDDGLLIYDRNGDGVVNDGSELFGDNTLLKNGERAANGYQALKELDDNGDGKVDAADSAFAKLRVWRDLNQDGISQEGELLTLEEAKVKALNLAHKNGNRDLGNGNTLAEEGTYTDSDGNEKQMGDLNLAADHFHSRYSNSLPLTDEQQQAPNLRGSGRVRDLREAAAESPDVAAALQAYANAQTKEEQLALRDQLLRAWAGTDKRFTTEGVLKAASKNVVMASKGKNSVRLTPSQAAALGTIEGPSIWSLLGIEDPEQKKKTALLEKVGILDAFTGTDSTHLYYGTKAQAQHTIDTIEKTYANLADNLYDGLLLQTRLKPYLNAIRFGMNEDGKLQLDYSGVAALFDEVHAKNPGKAFIDLGELLAKGNTDGKNTDMAPLAEKFVQYVQEASSNSTLEAYSKILGGNALTAIGYSLDKTYSDVLGEKNLVTMGYSLGKEGNDTLRGNDSANYLNGNKGNDTLWGAGGNDALYGAEGNDVLAGGDGNDFLDGGTGDDYLRGDVGNDILQGGEGDDKLYGGEGKDILDGGSGNDYLDGGNYGSDIYTFREGHGQDVVDERAYNDASADTLHFKGGIAEKSRFSREGLDLVIRAYGNNDRVTLKNYFNGDAYRYIYFQFDDKILERADIAKQTFDFNGTNDRDAIHGWITDDIIHGMDGNDNIYGNDGNDTLNGNEGDDILGGGNGNDHLNGGAGNDYLRGEAGDDTLDGGEGNDKLYGEKGKDILDGGAGNDHLAGGDYGSDIYLFRAGHGRDVIVERAGIDEEADILRFEGAKAEKGHFSREGLDLIIKAYGENDSVSLKDYFNGDNYRRFHFQFDDKTLETADIAQKTLDVKGTDSRDLINGWITDDIIYGLDGDDNLSGNVGEDTIYGGNGNDALFGGEGDDVLSGDDGNDILYGGNGNDRLDGGAGNDYLRGDAGHDILRGGEGNDNLAGGEYGSDTYIFHSGHGQDVVSDRASKDEDADTLRFEGTRSEDTHFFREGQDLVISAYDNDDRVTLKDYFNNYFNSDDYRRFYFQFDDKTLDKTDMLTKTFEFKGTENRDTINGWKTDDNIHGLGGDDTLSGNDGNDILYGDEGNDAIYGGNGDDHLYGGLGDDYLRGDNGNDVLQGGDGNDKLYGEKGEDILDGGTGNDHLEGGDYGKDTYLFRAGHGYDIVSDRAYKNEDADTLRFEGAKVENSKFRREGYNLIINAYGKEDEVSLKNYFSNEDNRRYDFQFDDATFKAAELRSKDLPTEGLKAPVAATAQTTDAAIPDSATAAVTSQENAATATADESKAQAAKVAEKVVEVDTFHPPLQLHKDDTALTGAVNQATLPASGKPTQSAAVTSVDSSAASKADTQNATVQQNAESVEAALKAGGATATPASTLDANAAQQSQQMLSAMAAQNQTATPTALAAPDLQPKPQLVASQV